MTEFDAVPVRGLRKTYRSGVVVNRLDIVVQRGEMVGVADGAGKTMTVERPLIGSQPQDSALPNQLRVAGPLDLFASPRARDGTELLEQFGLGERGRWGRTS